MSLAKRLATIQITQIRGCYTCHWLKSLSDTDRAAFDKWLADGNPAAQLWEVCALDPDNPLPVTESSFRRHLRHHDA